MSLRASDGGEAAIALTQDQLARTEGALLVLDGAEFGIGPNVTPAGTALVLATGMTFRAGAFNIPVNVAAVPSKSGARITILTGLSFRR